MGTRLHVSPCPTVFCAFAPVHVVEACCGLYAEIPDCIVPILYILSIPVNLLPVPVNCLS